MKDKKRINKLIKRKLKNNFEKCISSCKERGMAREKGIILFFKILKKLDSPGLHFGELKKEFSSEKTAVSVDIYSVIPVFEKGVLENLLEKRLSLILDIEESALKVKVGKKEIPLMKIKNIKEKMLLRQIKTTYKNIEYLKCW